MGLTTVCDVCHSRPKMDRCGCCEECWYSGRYSFQWPTCAGCGVRTYSGGRFAVVLEDSPLDGVYHEDCIPTSDRA